MPYAYIMELTKHWIIAHGFALAILVIIGFLIPRIGRRIIDGMSHAIDEDTEASKGRKAIIGAIVYIAEAIAYAALIITAMHNLGINLAAAAIPATVVSAAVGFGSQKIIGDLLGGFFIITEKQYGIGDWVKFFGSAATVEGDVVNMTLRATTIRTINGDEITVPNGEARMCVNSSARWARAVISIPVPITAGSSMAEIKTRTLAAAQHAINDPELSPHIRSDITFQAATDVIPPTAMGLPWTATMRLLIDVAPGKQWLIERGVRAAVIDEWWKDYGEKASSAVVLSEGIVDSFRQFPTDADTPLVLAEETHSAHPPVAPDPETTRALSHAAETIDLPRTEVMREIQEQSEEATTPRRSHGVLSFGDRVRPSTSILIICLLGFLTLGSMTLSGGENNKAGWLAPTQTPAPAAPTQTPAPAAPAAPVWTESTIPSGSMEPSSSAESTMPTPSSSPSSSPSETTLETPTTTDEPTVESSSSPSASESTTAP
ncbi:mechanosensitive ion channel family protein [Corynebacterium belfantii]|uniref:Mechanosensitive ion channel n=1 Tax=Corynebacterium belfantii TaxID=2014537 RepID=A0ABS0LA37_9CORY|nr:mechanosensitive ion channel domain-containing protein [Corynebacterium belfantii]OWM36695.1 small-conductance mechanosensitive channel [Corynebacterium diphtheriae subsp. lausannense]MBG9259503.1 mechanosensitive ion channel [Corynebacterium belfantii]MBG9266266.1 mechanosensitive ion channel [Corynebacterium belfantii]MBG9288052.1 mechanosensitive ion channel [Corynebacterium belfantii]MBG9299592.1 mechanosensitive ion channel [Corynebacterium belfantii]